MGTNTDKSPKNVTVFGRLSFPAFTHKEAVAKALKSSIAQIAQKAAATPEEISPEFNLLLEQAQLDKLRTHILDVFIPYVQANYAKDPKSRDSLDPKVVKKIQDKLASEDWDGVPFLPFKTISEKNQEAAPEAVVSIKLNGSKGQDIALKATVYNEDQMAIPDPDILSYPVVKDLKQTVFSMYAGAYVAATINLYAFYTSAGVNGISGGANAAVYRGNLEASRFGGGGQDIDEDDIFLDD